MKKLVTMMMLVAMVGLFASSAQATVLIDFNVVATTSPDSSSRYWNGTATTASYGYIITDAVDSSNNATTVDLNVTAGTWFSQGNAGSTNSSVVDWDSDQTYDNWMVRKEDDDIVLRFEGLTAGASYNLGFYGGRPGYSRYQLGVTIGGATKTIVLDQLQTFTRVTADASGYITATLDAPCATHALSYGYLAGIEIAPAPTVSVLFDFNNSVQGTTTSPDTSGRYWNGTATTPATGDIITDAVDSNNNPTTVDLTATGGPWYDVGAGSTGSSVVDWDADQTQDNWIVKAGDDITLRFEGLVAGEDYELGFYGGRPGYTTRTLHVTIDGTVKDIVLDELETFTLVTADANGYITATLSATNYGYLSGVELIIPEPATMTLLLLGLPFALRRRRK